MRAASGSAERENSVGSDIRQGTRDTENGARVTEKGFAARHPATYPGARIRHFHTMRQVQSLDAWRASQDLAARAYVLTVRPALHRHFALIDQIQRAAISIPANIAEG
ncbi:MAG: four helix bundle protein [Gemmatimonadetes bacterium]|nr:MAG: hypothetical protein DMD67_09615 [Gemmatimonadota bacterium]PYP01368.1 MAG: hypothetical protein DMD61_01535 [Gemmatimonadota bacterium]TLY52926.1 MAG: four helix bundle protein [Gemmatimonadota bacterium]